MTYYIMCINMLSLKYYSVFLTIFNVIFYILLITLFIKFNPCYYVHTTTTNQLYIFMNTVKIFNFNNIPIWFMRQAGRYMYEYNNIKKI